MMTPKSPFIRLIIAEDDDDDYILTERALKETGWSGELLRVRNGEELLDFLKRHEQDAERPASSLVLLDLNMPKKDGREALKELKEHEMLKKIPVIVFTTTPSRDDVFGSYEVGGNVFIRKPESYSEMVSLMKVVKAYWEGSVMLPPPGEP